jgi:hypothetical protein
LKSLVNIEKQIAGSADVSLINALEQGITGWKRD